MRTYTLILVFTSLVVTACSSQKSSPYSFLYQHNQEKAVTAPALPPIRFMLFSDPHTYDPELGTNGSAFQIYLEHDRKLLAESSRILDQAVRQILSARPDFVLVSGDLTKDGSIQSHNLFRKKLDILQRGGIPVYVIPGNHDLLNPHAVRFLPESTESVAHLVPQDFASHYTSYGYDRSLWRDTHSLSYVAEAAPGLWLLALDSTITSNNLAENYPTTDGEFNSGTLKWIEEVLRKAAQKKIPVIAMLHHGIIPHWPGQERLHEEYLLNNYAEIQNLFSHYGVRLVFTGHYHAQDIARQTWPDGRFLYDIMTGSLVTYPIPLRTATILPGNQLRISSEYITTISGWDSGFTRYAEDTAYNGIFLIARKTIMKYRVNQDRASLLAEKVAQAYVSHYRGDEKYSAAARFSQKGMGLMGRLVILNQSYVLEGLYRDSDGADNEILIDLNNGEWVLPR